MKLRKALSLVLAVMMLAALVVTAAADDGAVTLENAVVTPLQIGDNEVLVYYPQPNATDTLGISTTCTAPAFVVFGEGSFDATSADAFAAETGLGAIAAREGASICFVNPVEGTWSEADAAVYEMIVSAINDSSTNEVSNGISAGFDFMSGQMKSGIMATAQRIYVYGVGAGADFVAAHYIRPVVSSVTYPDGFTMTFDRSATSVTVSGLTDVSGIEPNDLPVISIGNSEEINKALAEACGNVLVDAEADYEAEYAALAGLYRRQAGVLVPVYDWAAEGITEEIKIYEVATSSDNGSAFAGTESHPVGCAIYYANDLDVQNTKVPLVFCFHGGGNTALYEAQATEWPLIGKENGFITVSVDLHYPNVTPTELVELLEQLKAEYAIDETKIYASGFSMGGCKSWDLFEQYPQVFAGLAPMDATNDLGLDSYGNQVENMNQKIEPVLEKYVKDDEYKEITESTHILTTSPQEVVKPKPNPVIIEQQKKILENQEKLNKESKEFRFSQKMKEEGKIRGRRNTSFFPPSLNFLKSFDVIEKPNYNINEEPKGELEDLSLGKNIIEKEDTSDMENLKSIYGYNQKEEFNPVLQSLQKRLEELQNKREEIKKQFEYDKKLYLKRIKNLEKIKNTKLDEMKLKFLKNEKKQNEKVIVELKIKIEQTETDTIQDREKLEGQLNYISELKNNLIKELNELQILANKSSFEDYNDYMKNDPTKIEKTNFRPDDSRYLLTNEYETSRDEEESISSYDKLNHINNTPEGFEINRQNIYLNKTLNNNYSHINTKSSKSKIAFFSCL